MSNIGTFPFGLEILPVRQQDRHHKQIFVLGVYASAVHAHWTGPHGKTIIQALAVASEPEIFWCGDNVDDLVREVPIPEGAGRLTPASRQLNGPSGRALDEMFLAPLGISRQDVWLCDLVPHSCMNERQSAAIERVYRPMMTGHNLPQVRWPKVPRVLVDDKRRAEIVDEVNDASPAILVTLGDQPLRWFTSQFGTKRKLSSYGESSADYGRLHDFDVEGRRLRLLPLVHPRQAGKLGSHSSKWSDLHAFWCKDVAPRLL